MVEGEVGGEVGVAYFVAKWFTCLLWLCLLFHTWFTCHPFACSPFPSLVQNLPQPSISNIAQKM